MNPPTPSKYDNNFSQPSNNWVVGIPQSFFNFESPEEGTGTSNVSPKGTFSKTLYISNI